MSDAQHHRHPAGDHGDSAKIGFEESEAAHDKARARAIAAQHARLTVKLAKDELAACFGGESKRTKRVVYERLVNTLTGYDERRQWLSSHARREVMADELRRQLQQHVMTAGRGQPRQAALRVALRHIFQDDELVYRIKAMPARDANAAPPNPMIAALLAQLDFA